MVIVCECRLAAVALNPAVRTAAARALATAADEASLRMLRAALQRESDPRTKRQMERLMRTAGK